jgi:hypothetical protein
MTAPAAKVPRAAPTFPRPAKSETAVPRVAGLTSVVRACRVEWASVKPTPKTSTAAPKGTGPGVVASRPNPAAITVAPQLNRGPSPAFLATFGSSREVPTEPTAKSADRAPTSG